MKIGQPPVRARRMLTPPPDRCRRCLLLLLLLLLASPAPHGAASPSAPVVVPAGFEDTVVTTLSRPTDITFTPDGRMLLTSQTGQLYIYQNGVLHSAPALDLSASTCSNGERGLLGVAVDPAFSINRFIYLYYTYNKFNNSCPSNTADTPVNRVARFTLPDSNVIDSNSQLVLVDNIASPSGFHNAGGVEFDAAGLLYISVGDGGPSNNARLLDRLNGKLLRIASDGSIPTDNPYASSANSRRCGDPAGVPAGAGPCREIFSYGLRNPFRFSFRPGSNEFYINDVGASVWEEIDIGQRGANYGWDVREGPCARGSTTNCGPPPAGMTNPIYAYNHSDGCISITGGAFVPEGVWPAPYSGAYLFADLGCGTIFRLVPGASSYSASPFATGLGYVVALAFGPHAGSQALYYTLYSPTGQPAAVRRIAYTAASNRAPSAVLSASPTSGASPLPVNFDASGSSDPDGDSLTFDWDFGDGTQVSGGNPTVSHTYASGGTYTAVLSVRDSRGAVSAPATQRIDVDNQPPTPVINAPTSATRFRVGQQITLQGSASDPQDGVLPDTALSWDVVLHHIDENSPQNAHTHPFLAPTPGNGIVIMAPAPEDLNATALSYLEIRLTATDSTGLAATTSQRLDPNRVQLNFETQPAGLRLQLGTLEVVAPRTISSWEGYSLSVAAPNQRDAAGSDWAFVSWSDGGARTHTISTPATNASYSASFTPAHMIWMPLLGR